MTLPARLLLALSAMLAGWAATTACGDSKADGRFDFDPVAVWTVPPEFQDGIRLTEDTRIYGRQDNCMSYLADRIFVLVLEDFEDSLARWFDSIGLEVVERTPSPSLHGPAVALEVRVPLGAPPAAVVAVADREGVEHAGEVGLIEGIFPCTPTPQ